LGQHPYPALIKYTIERGIFEKERGIFEKERGIFEKNKNILYIFIIYITRHKKDPNIVII